VLDSNSTSIGIRIAGIAVCKATNQVLVTDCDNNHVLVLSWVRDRHASKNALLTRRSSDIIWRRHLKFDYESLGNLRAVSKAKTLLKVIYLVGFF